MERSFICLAVATEISALAMAAQYGFYISYPLIIDVKQKDMSDSDQRIMTNLAIGYKACTGVLIFLDAFSAILLLVSMQRIY